MRSPDSNSSHGGRASFEVILDGRSMSAAGSDASANANRGQRECRCAMASLALFVCTTLLPAKALAHVAALVLHERASRVSKLSNGRRLA